MRVKTMQAAFHRIGWGRRVVTGEQLAPSQQEGRCRIPGASLGKSNLGKSNVGKSSLGRSAFEGIAWPLSRFAHPAGSPIDGAGSRASLMPTTHALSESRTR